MAKRSPATQWAQILIDAAESVRTTVRTTLLNKTRTEIQELKRLLDSEAQKAIHASLKETGYPVNVISEEGDYTLGQGGPYLVVDPVDGTTNLAKGIPLSVTSLAISETPHLSGVQAGIVMDLYSGEVYRAEKGKGAWRGGKRLSTSGPRLLDDAMVSLDISKGHPLETVEPIIKRAKYMRQLGSSALALCQVASGTMDAHVDLRGSLRVMDTAAGLLILKEAGGIYAIDGEPEGDIELAREATMKLIAASNPGTLEELMSKTS